MSRTQSSASIAIAWLLSKAWKLLSAEEGLNPVVQDGERSPSGDAAWM